MAKTLVADVIVPEEFEKYAIERTATLSAFMQSGIVEQAPEFAALAAGGGREVKMPFWKDLIGDRQILSDANPLTVNRITAGQDVAAIHNDGNAWSVNQLAAWLSGDDPLQAIVDLVAGYWARVDQSMVLASLKGMFASAGMAANLHKIASEKIAEVKDSTRLNGVTFVDATQKLGDHARLLTAIAMHSATEAALRKLDLIDEIPASEGKPVIATFQGRRVVVDDGLPVRDGETDGKVYTSYLFGSGAFAKGAAPLTSAPLEGGIGTEGVEIARDALASDTVLINRRRHILHPRGVKFTAEIANGESPSNEALATGDNWTRVWEAKNVRIVAVEHNN